MRIADLSVSKLVNLAQNLITLLAGPELSAINPAVRADLLASFGTKPARIAELDAKAKRLLNEAAAAFAARDEVIQSLETDVLRTKDSLKSGRAHEDQFFLAGFNYPFERRGTYVAQIPSGVAVVGFSNKVNQGTFKGNNRSGAVVYEIWRREGRGGEWLLRMWSKTQEFTDEEVRLGQYYEYKVCAVASKNRSAFSNTAKVGEA